MCIKLKTFTLLAIAQLIGVSCTSRKITERLNEGFDTQTSEINALMAQLDDGAPPKPIRWKAALARMHRDNLAIDRSNKLLEEAEKERRRIWRQLVPRVSGYVNLSSGLNSLLDFSSDEVNRTLSANFNIPNPFNFYAALYGAGLRYENARCSHQLDRRRAYVTLYQAYLESKDMHEKLLELQSDMHAASVKGGEESADDLYRVQQRWVALKRQKKRHRANVNKLFDTPGGNWELKGELPDVSFRNNYRDVKIGGDFGKLAMYLYAIRMESAILARKQVKFRQWPILNFGISQPPLYASSSSQGYEFENFRLFSGASKSIDMVDPLGLDEIQDANKRFAYTRRAMRQSMEREALRLNDLRDSYHQLLLTEQRLLHFKKILESEAPGETEVVLVQLEAINNNNKRLGDVRRQIVRLDLQYLVWNETFWK